MEQRVVPRVARGHAAFAIGALGVDLLQLREDAAWSKAEPEGEMNHVHAEVAHDADFAAEAVLPFPVDRLGWVEIAAVPKAGADFQEAAEMAGADVVPDFLRAGQEGKLGGAADETALSGGFVADRARGAEIDAEGLLGEQIFACAQHIEVDSLVQMMRHGDIDDIDGVAAEQLTIVGGDKTHRWDSAKPFADWLLHIADRGEFKLCGRIKERAPAADGAGHFAAHEPAANDSEAHRGHGVAARCRAASEAVAPS